MYCHLTIADCRIFIQAWPTEILYQSSNTANICFINTIIHIHRSKSGKIPKFFSLFRLSGTAQNCENLKSKEVHLKPSSRLLLPLLFVHSTEYLFNYGCHRLKTDYYIQATFATTEPQMDCLHCKHSSRRKPIAVQPNNYFLAYTSDNERK